jgi:hypothetical protein
MRKYATDLLTDEQGNSTARQNRGEGGIHGAIWSTAPGNVPTRCLAAQAVALLVRATWAVLSLAGAGEVTL